MSLVGGLEGVKDINVQSTLADRLSIAEECFSRAYSDSLTRAHALPLSTLHDIGRADAVGTCRLLRPCFFQVPGIDYLGLHVLESDVALPHSVAMAT